MAFAKGVWASGPFAPGGVGEPLNALGYRRPAVDGVGGYSGLTRPITVRGGTLAVQVWPLVTLGFVEVSGGDYPAALRALEPLIAAAPAMGYGEPTAAPFAPDAAEALIAVGRNDEARALVTQLLDNGRRQMEVMNAIIMSLPGTPIVYYGDEIGRGD
jgi:hypothetical protein